MNKEEIKKYKDYEVIGLIETIKIFNNLGNDENKDRNNETDNHNKTKDGYEIKAKIDTGADTSSLDLNLLAKLKLSPIQKIKKVKSANGRSVRPVISAEIEILGKRCKEYFTVIDRKHMRYKILIGKNILRKLKVLIDPNKKSK